jgi:AcrR family transcriptional regulator
VDKRKESRGRKGTSGPARRREAVENADGAYHHGNLRLALVEGGLSFLARKGPAGFSLRALAQELGVSHAAPYRHFASRDELLLAIVAESRGRLAEALKRSVAGPELAGARAMEKIYILGETFVGFYVENPEVHYLFNILPGQLASQGEKLRELVFPEPSGRQDPTFLLLRSTVAELREDFAGLSDRDILLGCWAKVHGLASILVAQPDYFAPEDIAVGIKRVIRRPF